MPLPVIHSSLLGDKLAMSHQLAKNQLLSTITGLARPEAPYDAVFTKLMA